MMASRYSRYYSRPPALLAFACGIILVGLVLRRYGYQVGLPFIIVKYGGSVLWGSMIYLLVASLFQAKHRLGAIVVACIVAITVELIRLVHFPALDAFRETAVGALLLGRVFSLWNIGCYIAGVVLVALIEARLWKT
ncbi:DUF2809 domain-containing protein [Agrobacterium sp. rho-8.1]|nr:DUF2809 domain-containing protein [Agrobacterium sp. rho-8.1]